MVASTFKDMRQAVIRLAHVGQSEGERLFQQMLSLEEFSPSVGAAMPAAISV